MQLHFNYYRNTILLIFNRLVRTFVLSDAIVLPRSCFLIHVFLSYVLSLMCETVLRLKLIFVELGQAHYK